jgi:hypothetical protein
MSEYRTDQEPFGAGRFEDDYLARKRGERLIASNLALFAKALSRTMRAQSSIEFCASVRTESGCDPSTLRSAAREQRTIHL